MGGCLDMLNARMMQTGSIYEDVDRESGHPRIGLCQTGYGVFWPVLVMLKLGKTSACHASVRF